MHDFWNFLEERRISDNILAGGYEQAGPVLRGHMKKNIAAQHELLEQRLPPEFQRMEISYGATFYSRTASAAPWCLIVHESDYPAAPRALAAAVPAQLAGTPLVWSVALHAKNAAAALPATVSAAWELAGIENVAALEMESFLVRLRAFMDSPACAAQGPGRVLILGSPVWSKEIFMACRNERKALLRLEGPPPRILLAGTTAKAHHSTLSALHPDAALRLAPQNAEEVYDAVFSDGPFPPPPCNRTLRLDYGHCGCWFWPGLDAAFFLNHSFSCSTRCNP